MTEASKVVPHIGENKGDLDKGAARLPVYTLVAAALLAVAWLIASWLMYERFVPPGQPEAWDRALVLYNGLSAVGFTAIGVLLGTQVQQVNVAAARREAASARQGEAEAKSGAAATKAGARAAAKAAGAGDDRGGAGVTDANAALVRLALVRNQLIDIL
ncbi:hypothetical protein [Sphingomonas sp. PvP018]|uniref:hypothetical protein n=1 Tax=Sphingomonas sp. PvP018 TaxID=2817852 RepID=UPI001AE74629|nr:hypothetical protein [Sphingomonas sp. PvP018]MBP2511752.1 hypothetical protein [Sphingomonas sp. PvP018]